jgi:hypothetical protein
MANNLKPDDRTHKFYYGAWIVNYHQNVPNVEYIGANQPPEDQEAGWAIYMQHDESDKTTYWQPGMSEHLIDGERVECEDTCIILNKLHEDNQSMRGLLMLLS